MFSRFSLESSQIREFLEEKFIFFHFSQKSLFFEINILYNIFYFSLFFSHIFLHVCLGDKIGECGKKLGEKGKKVVKSEFELYKNGKMKKILENGKFEKIDRP